MAVTISGSDGISGDLPTIKVGNGSESAPAVTGQDTDTGLFFGTNEVKVSTGGTEAIVVDSSQQVGIGTSSPASALHISGTGVADSRATFTRSGVDGVVGVVGDNLLLAGDTSNGGIEFFTAGVSRAKFTTDGKLVLGGITPATSVNYSLCTSGRVETDATYSVTTSSSANVNIGSSGLLQRSTSSAKYKTNIETMEDSYADAVLNARPVWFNSTASEDTAHPEWGYWGFIAEEIHEIDPRLVFYGEDDDGNLEPEGVQYDRFIPHLVNLIKRQKQAIETLETKVAALEAAE